MPAARSKRPGSRRPRGQQFPFMVNVRLTPEHYEMLTNIADSRDVSVSEALRLALEGYVSISRAAADARRAGRKLTIDPRAPELN